MVALLVVAQAAAFILLVARLLPGRTRRPAVAPLPEGITGATVSVVVATLNEARRITPCLEGLHAQGAPLHEVIVVDSHSTDGTQELVAAMARRDPRFRLVLDPPLPEGWIGKVWALQHGLREATGEWVLGVDADTEPKPGMVAAAVHAAQQEGFDVVSFSPCFAAQSGGERWLQPSMLVTIVYRFGAAGRRQPPPDKVMANGQCFLARRDLLLRHGGYEPARRSFADDVTLARHLARAGARVGFLDGSQLYLVRAYTSARQMWREWGRSIDLQDATTPARQWGDVLFLALVQGLPLPVLASLAFGATRAPATAWLLTVNAALVTMRLLLLFGLRGSYAERGLPFWLSPLSDPLALIRVLLSTVSRPTDWRGRSYRTLAGSGAAVTRGA